MKGLVKNKTLALKIGTTILVLLVFSVFIISPTIIKKLRGDISQSESLENTSNKVVLSTIYNVDSSTNKLNFNIYNGNENDITVNKIIYRNECKTDNCDSFTLVDLENNIIKNDEEKTLVVDNSEIINLLNTKTLEVGVQYELNGQSYNVYSTVYHLSEESKNNINITGDDIVEKEFKVASSKISDSDNGNNPSSDFVWKMKISDTKVSIDKSETLYDQKIYYSFMSNYKNAWFFDNPQNEDSLTKPFFGGENKSNIQNYFDFPKGLEDKYPEDSPRSRSGNGKVAYSNQYRLMGTLKNKVQSITNKNIVLGFYFENYFDGVFVKQFYWSDQTEDYNYKNNYGGFSSSEVPNFTLTIYDKSGLLSSLNSFINKLQALNSSEIEKDSMNSYINLINNAKKLYESRDSFEECDLNGSCTKKEVTQDLIDEVKLKLDNTEINKMKQANYAEFHALIEKINKLNLDWYTKETYDNFKNVYDVHTSYEYLPYVYQTKIDNYVSKLNKVYNELELKDADYTELNKVKQEASKISNKVNEIDGLYTKETWNNLQEALNNVKTGLKIDKQEEVDKYTLDIRNAIDSLVKNKADYKKLDTIINNYKNSEEYKNDYWTDDSKAKVEKYINNIIHDKYIDEQSVVDNYITELSNLINKLQLKVAKGYYDSDNYHPNNLKDSLSLEGYINYFKAEIVKKVGNTNLYTDDTISKVNKIINTYFDENGSFKADLEYITINNQSKMDDLIIKLDNIKKNELIKTPANYTNLKGWIEKAEKVNRNYYKDLSTLDQMLSKAKEALKLGIDEQDNVDIATKNLSDAINNLELKDADYTELNKLLNTFKKLDENIYYNYDEVLNNIEEIEKQINYNLDITNQKIVDELTSKIKAEYNKLNKKPADYSKLSSVLAKIPSDYSKYSYSLKKEILNYIEETKKLSLELKLDEQYKIDELVNKGNLLLAKLEKDDSYNYINDNKVSNNNTTSSNSSIKNNITTRRNQTTNYNDNNKNENIIKQVKINGKSIKFDNNEATLNVSYKTSKVDVEVELKSKDYKYTVYGGRILVHGNNEVTIIVTDNDGNTYRYLVIVKRAETSNNLLNLKVKNYDLGFKENKKDYVLYVDRKVEKLDLSFEKEDNNSSVKVIGNDKLKNNSKIQVKVTDTSKNVKTYTITIKKTNNNILYYVIIVILLSVLVGGLRYMVIRKRG